VSVRKVYKGGSAIHLGVISLFSLSHSYCISQCSVLALVLITGTHWPMEHSIIHPMFKLDWTTIGPELGILLHQRLCTFTPD
jgi:hypothetical protein